MKAQFSPAWRVITLLSLALIVCAPYASGETVLNVQQATLQEPDQKTPEISTEELRR